MAETIIEVEILEDGTVSYTTGDIADTLHVAADDMIMEAEQALGGKSERKKREHPFWAKRSVGLHGKITRTA